MHAILAFESSCDETAVALVGPDGRVYSQAIASQIEIHRKFGGVVPEVASRSHFDVIDSLAAQVLAEGERLGVKIVKVAATQGPGLIGPLLVASSYARGLALGWKLPFVGIHHLRGHLASCLLAGPTSGESAALPAGVDLRERARTVFPALVLLVSGGHTQILEVDATLTARALLDTVDDAAGECFDKSAKLMGLPYPGGPAIEVIAAALAPKDRPRAQEIARKLPRPKTSDGNFSFSGLKTAIRLVIEQHPELVRSPLLCWAIQEAIAGTLVLGLARAAQALGSLAGHRTLIFCGGVSANLRIRGELETWGRAHGLDLLCPPLAYCTDNAAMIGACAWVQHPALELETPTARVPLAAVHA